jgi:hypothetical protein
MSKNQTINDALKALFLELGGDSTKLADNQKISDYIDDLATVLNVGGNEPFVITISRADGSTTPVIDKTFTEIKEAFLEGKNLVAKFVNFAMTPEDETTKHLDKVAVCCACCSYDYETGTDITGFSFNGVVFSNDQDEYKSIWCDIGSNDFFSFTESTVYSPA